MVTKLDSFNEGLAMSERTSLQQNFSLDGSFARKHVIDDTLEKHTKRDLLQEKALSTDTKVSATNISKKNWEMSYKKMAVACNPGKTTHQISLKEWFLFFKSRR